MYELVVPPGVVKRVDESCLHTGIVNLYDEVLLQGRIH